MDIAVLTTGRADYGILRPVIAALSAEFDVRLVVTGAHLAEGVGGSLAEIESDGWLSNSDHVAILDDSNEPAGICRSIGRGMLGFGAVYEREPPDLLIVVGDRFETLAAVAAALPFRIPVAHLHGGEVSFGAIDEQMRHAITKMSHLHFVSTDIYRDRVLQMGEEDWRVTVTGAPGLDSIRTTALLSADELESRLGMELKSAPILVTYHPETLDPAANQVAPLLQALSARGEPIVFTAANADAGGRAINDAIAVFCDRRPNSRMFDSLGTSSYCSLMACACAMVGNSSSGIIEAASFGLPVVNVGRRQEGRLHGANVIDVARNADAIAGAIERALTPAFRETARAVVNPYGDGQAAERILAGVQAMPSRDILLRKRFVDRLMPK